MKESQPKNNWRRWYDELAKTGSPELLKNWYGEVASAYNRTRPSYPRELIDRAIEIAQLPPEAIVLELGCGPGTATVDFAKSGLGMVCLEPSPDACELARQNCDRYPNVAILNTTFEKWPLEADLFSAVLAATSFHWISPDIACAKAAAALNERGSLILLWNTPPQPNYELFQILRPAYRTHAPTLDRYDDKATYEENFCSFGRAVLDSGYFHDLVSEQLTRHVTYSIDDYLALLSTLSPYIALEAKQREALFAELRDILEGNCGLQIELSHLSALQVARKRS
ncbi:class I SAM-dependent methyltransferase [Oscillatoriales cyanobacterium LEGE 11467]|uniref:Class I SAM-dependent methyltransferase n=1 Tax=Zarconia navalis LEGE 11467 TaxID=1828826 RepID=A0A928ZAH0_9CYAN|nr:class I SAM-dependent methyltransferase [Zarconia navalis]MBE9042683.1 class I SAM-dependent methyltransferase [Zarconia navalis LEGE 11467]